MTDPDISPESLASALAARLIHDVMGPASGIVSAFDLLGDPSAAAMREEALELAEDSARKLVDMLVLSRAIYSGGTAMSVAELQRLAQGLFSGTRASLELTLDPVAISTMSGRLLLGLIQIAASAVAAGGVVRARLDRAAGRAIINGSARGARLRVGDEVLAGLRGEGPGSAQRHRWSAAYLLSAVARSAGGGVEASVDGGELVFHADISADMA